jgi:ribonuclease HI
MDSDSFGLCPVDSESLEQVHLATRH